MSSSIVYLNVGGFSYATTLETLQSGDKRSLLAEWFPAHSSCSLPTDKGGNYFIDRDGPIFRHILNYLRLKKNDQRWEASLPNQPDQLAALAEEADYYRLPELREKAVQLLTTWGGEKMTMSSLLSFDNTPFGMEYGRHPIYIPTEHSTDD